MATATNSLFAPPAGGRSRVQGSSWQSPDQIEAAKAEREKADQEFNAKNAFKEYNSKRRNATVFEQTPYSESTHCELNAYIELDAESKKIEKVVAFFFKQTTCAEFCDLLRRQLFDGVFKERELELYLADDDGNFDDQNEPPPGNQRISQIVDIGLDSFYFRIANAWQLSAEDKGAMERKIEEHKDGLSEFVERNGDSDDDDDDSEKDSEDECTPPPQEMGDGVNGPKAGGCCVVL